MNLISFYTQMLIIVIRHNISIISRISSVRYDNVTLIPLVLQLGLRIGPIQRMGEQIKIFVRYDIVTLIPLVLQLGLRIGRSHSTYGSKLKFSLSEYFNFLFSYLVITYYSLQFLSNGDTK